MPEILIQTFLPQKINKSERLRIASEVSISDDAQKDKLSYLWQSERNGEIVEIRDEILDSKKNSKNFSVE